MASGRLQRLTSTERPRCRSRRRSGRGELRQGKAVVACAMGIASIRALPMLLLASW